jgi:hypothetical protein
MPHEPLAGRCLCGAVTFELLPPVRDVIVCHCRQCARWTGYAVAATAVTSENFRLIQGKESLKWYSASEHAERGFCSVCGSSLFWKPSDGSRISVLAGALDPPTHLKVSAHIFVADKSDYYEIKDEVPCFADGAGEAAAAPSKA